MAAQRLASLLAFQRLDLDLDAEMGDYQAGLLGAEVAAFEFVERTGFALGRTGGALFLDLLDAPALPATELAFGHGGSAWEKTARV
ncbi:hypothetical protein D9M71_587840 [compost metagenome]